MPSFRRFLNGLLAVLVATHCLPWHGIAGGRHAADDDDNRAQIAIRAPAAHAVGALRLKEPSAGVLECDRNTHGQFLQPPAILTRDVATLEPAGPGDAGGCVPLGSRPPPLG